MWTGLKGGGIQRPIQKMILHLKDYSLYRTSRNTCTRLVIAWVLEQWSHVCGADNSGLAFYSHANSCQTPLAICCSSSLMLHGHLVDINRNDHPRLSDSEYMGMESTVLYATSLRTSDRSQPFMVHPTTTQYKGSIIWTPEFILAQHKNYGSLHIFRSTESRIGFYASLMQNWITHYHSVTIELFATQSAQG